MLGWAIGEMHLSLYLWTVRPDPKRDPKIIEHEWEEGGHIQTEHDPGYRWKQCRNCGLVFEWQGEVRDVFIGSGLERRHPTVREFESCMFPVRILKRVVYQGQ
jgi:hypothetical protein